MRSHHSTAMLLLFVAVTFAAPALANESRFTFNLQREVVLGNKNGIFHKLDAGALTISGKVWLKSRKYGAGTPRDVTIAVHEDTLLGTKVCSITATLDPSGRAASFTKAWDAISAGTYYVIAYKLDNGWKVEGEGALTTK